MRRAGRSEMAMARRETTTDSFSAPYEYGEDRRRMGGGCGLENISIGR